jgi:glucose/arabinose dehydrogenase
MKNLALFVLCLATFATHAQSPAPARRYAELCATCHTPDPRTFRGSDFVRGGSEAGIAAVIRQGRPARGMPTFAATVTEPESLALAAWLKLHASDSPATPTMIDRRIEAEDLRRDRSAGYDITQEGETRYLQYIDRGSHLCYDDVDLTGVRSLEYRYAKGPGEPPRRFAVVAFAGEFVGGARYNLGEKITALTEGWTQFRTERIGFSRQLEGRHRLCLIGMGGGGVFNLDWITLSDAAAGNDGVTLSFDAAARTYAAGGHRFRLYKVGETDGEFWSLDFLDADTVIATQKTGMLWIFRRGERRGPIAGIPAVAVVGQGGLLSVRAHPDHARNGWIYLTYAEGLDGKTGLTIVRGRIRDGRWVDQENIYREPRFFIDSGAHFGGRLTFDGDYLFFGIGERGHETNAQDPTNPFGKVHRLFLDGRVPQDNPFVATAGAVPTIWTLGHRNPQGLSFDTRARTLWSTEHGPKGGDELNLIQRGRNYGWPRATHGINYDGTIVSPHSALEGMESPRLHWSPSPGMSNLVLFRGRAFPRWRGHLLVATLAHQQLKLIRLDGDRVESEEILLDSLGRIRDVIEGPDGHPYIALNQPNGQIYRLVPE